MVPIGSRRTRRCPYTQALMRVALTGASGYTGGRLLAALRARGDDVAVLVRPASVTERIRSRASRVVEGDLGDAAAASRLVEGADAVVHVAAVYRTAGHPDSYYREVNVGGHRAAPGGGRAPGRPALRPHLDGGRPRPRRAPSGGRDRPLRPGRHLPGHEGGGRGAGPRLPPPARRCRSPWCARAPSTGRGRRASSSSSAPSRGAATRSWAPGAPSTTPSTSTTW